MAWKWDQVLWDEDRYYVSVGREFQRLPDGSLAIQVRAMLDDARRTADLGGRRSFLHKPRVRPPDK